MKIHEYNEMMAYLTRPAMAYGGRIGFAAGTPINQEIKNLILKLLDRVPPVYYFQLHFQNLIAIFF